MDALVWLILEALAALGLLVLLVWWTWPRRNSNDDADQDR
jgi:hypothetical protein